MQRASNIEEQQRTESYSGMSRGPLTKSEVFSEYIQDLIFFYGLDTHYKKEYTKSSSDVRPSQQSDKEGSKFNKNKMYVSRQLKTGSYRARVDVEAAFFSTWQETWFDVIHPPLSVQFMGGTFRNISTDIKLLTLYAEVRDHSSSSYKLRWRCSVPSEKEGNAGKRSCFRKDRDERYLWSTFQRETKISRLPPGVGNVLKRLLEKLSKNRENFHTFFRVVEKDSKIDALKSLFSDSLSGTADVRNLHKTFANETTRQNFIQSIMDDESDLKASFHFWNVFLLLLSLFPNEDLEAREAAGERRMEGGSVTYKESLTIPRSALREGVTLLQFSVEAYDGKESASSIQTIVLSDYSKDSVGIAQLTAGQIPFGSTRRAAFESNCHTCSENDLKKLEYHWQLGEIIQGVVEEEQVERTGMEDYRGMLRRGCAGFECLKSKKIGEEEVGVEEGQADCSSEAEKRMKMDRNFYDASNEKEIINSFGERAANSDGDEDPRIDYDSLNSDAKRWEQNIQKVMLRNFASRAQSVSFMTETYLAELCGQNALLKELLENGSKLERKSESTGRSPPLSRSHLAGSSGLSMNGFLDSKEKESLHCPISFTSIFSYCGSIVFPISPSSVYSLQPPLCPPLRSPLDFPFSQSSFFPPEWEIRATNDVKEILNASVCSELVLVARELFSAGIKFTRERTKSAEGEAEGFHLGDPLSPAGRSTRKRFNENPLVAQLLSLSPPPPPLPPPLQRLSQNMGTSVLPTGSQQPTTTFNPSTYSLYHNSTTTTFPSPPPSRHHRRCLSLSLAPHDRLLSSGGTRPLPNRDRPENSEPEEAASGIDLNERRLRRPLPGALRPPSLHPREISRNPNVNSFSQPDADNLPLSTEGTEASVEFIQPKSGSEEIENIEYPHSKYFANRIRRQFEKLQRRRILGGKNPEISTNAKSSNVATRFLVTTETKFTKNEQPKNSSSSFARSHTTVKFMDPRKVVAMTSTGVNEPVLVLYTDTLDKRAHYVLSLRTFNRANNKTGEASQVLAFSTQPFLKECNFREVAKLTYRSGCQVVGGMYYPIRLMYSYHLSRPGQGTVFYFGSLPWIEFTLPSGSQANNYSVYVTITAVDSVGYVSSTYEGKRVRVEPRYKTTGGVYSLFLDICMLGSTENPAIELQHIRSLAWELNILPPNVILQILDNILTLVVYRDECEDSIRSQTDLYSVESFGFQSVDSAEQKDELRSSSFKQRFLMYADDWIGNRNMFVRSNLLKSCARDKVVLKAAQIQSRDEIEVMMMITALTIIVDAPEYISWLTFQRVVDAMLDAKKHHMWFWELQSQVRIQVTENYFILTSTILSKQYEIYDCPSVPYDMVTTIIDSLLKVMAKELTSRFLEEEPLSYMSSYMKFDGYLAKSDNLNVWSNRLPFYFEDKTVDLQLPGIHTVMGLLHYQSPYSNTSVEINSCVLNLKLSWRSIITKKLKVFLPRSLIVTGNNYDFRKKGALSYDRLGVYAFDVKKVDLHKTLFITLQITRIYTSVSAIIMICRDMQSLDDPLLREDLDTESLTTTMLIRPGMLPEGSYLLLVMEKNSYENLWARYNVKEKHGSSYGVDFMLGAWWSECFVWEKYSWMGEFCQPTNASSWHSTHCSCSSFSTTYGAVSEPLLTEEDQVTVNELMLVPSFVAVYFIIALLVSYTVVFLFLFRRENRLTKRRNVWLQDNDPHHEFAYLLTIKTGHQTKAGTSSTVFAILNGTQAMSRTQELQSKTGDVLFSRGSVCSFVVTSPVSLGDIMSVQLWHDNYEESSGWFVCEVSVVDLRTRSKFVYPCYKWLSVASDDAQVVREITFEKPTTFLQDFEHFLPQNVGEHTFWYSLFATSNSKFFKLQTLTIFIIVCLFLGTLSLSVVKRINSSHTMITPDPHIETLFSGFMIAFVVLPLQWLLRLVFKASNILEERISYNRIVRSMINERPQKKKRDEKPKKETKKFNIDDESEFYDPNSDFWRTVSSFAKSFGPMDVDERYVHPSFVKLVREANEAELRRRRVDSSANDSGKRNEASGSDQKTPQQKDGTLRREENQRKNECFGDRRTCSTEDRLKYYQSLNSGKLKQRYKDFIISAVISMSIGWLISFGCIAICIIILVKEGSGMPKDYSSLWLQTVFIAVCASSLIIQPLVITLFTFYKVCEYRFFDTKGLLHCWAADSVDQAIAVWNYYKEKIIIEIQEQERNDDEETKKTKELKKIERERYLRFARPPPEHVLLHHRKQFIIQSKISSLLKKTFWYFGFFGFIFYIISCIHLQDRFYLNQALRNAALNGSCISRDSPLYKSFSNITTGKDWWDWAYSELLDITFNYNRSYSSFKMFCDSESIIIGTPRIRMYEVKSEPCDADSVTRGNNKSFSEVYKIKKCYPDYKDTTSHFYGFSHDQDPHYKWDAHYLSVIHGYFSSYSYTSNEKVIPDRRFDAAVYLLFLQLKEWLKLRHKQRAIITEFTLFHPQSRLYSSVEFVAEFPSLSGAKPTIVIASSSINSSEPFFISAAKHGNLILVAVAMFFLRKSTIDLYKNRGWKTLWNFIDFCVTALCWSYVVCLMLRVHIAEDLLWEMKITYYERYVNIKSLTAWDYALTVVIGLLFTVHLIRFLELFSFIPRFKMYNAILYKGTIECFKVSGGVLFFVLICGNLGFIWFGRFTEAFSSLMRSFICVLKTLVLRTSFYALFTDYSSSQLLLADIFFLLVFFLLFFMVFGIYKAIFIYTKKHHVYIPAEDNFSYKDFIQYLKKKWHLLKTFFSRKRTTESSENNFKSHSCNMHLTEMESLINSLETKVNSLYESLENNFHGMREEIFGKDVDETKLVDKNYTLKHGRDSEVSSGVFSTDLSRDFPEDKRTIQKSSIAEVNISFNFDALDEILSSPSEMNPSTINLLSELLRREQDENISSQAIYNNEHIIKFLNDVESLSSDQLQVMSHGKYGKSEARQKKGRNFLTFISEKIISDLQSGFDAPKTVTSEEVKNVSDEEKVYFSSVPISFEGMDELLAQYCCKENYEESEDI